jgi:FkbM family methyltransferase
MPPFSMIARRALRRVIPTPIALAVRREWVARRVAWDLEQLETDIALLPQYVRSTDVCWDIGASSGTYTVALSRLAARVLAFEPIPHSFDILERVTERAGLKNVSTARLAIADTNGPARMSVPSEGFYGGYYMAALDDRGTVPVTTASIDQLIALGWPEPDFIKCDVEGAEGRVLDGARSLIARRHPLWLLETFDDEMFPRARSLGYATYVNIGNGEMEPVQSRRVTERNYWLLPV